MRWGILILFGLFFVSFASAVIPDNCDSSTVAYWKFDGNSIDSVGGHNGVLGGATTLSEEAKVGAYSLNLDAGTDAFTVAHNPALTPSDGLTIEFWMKRSPGSGIPRKVITKTGYSILSQGLSISADVGTATLSGNINADGATWDFITIAWNGSTVKLYIDNSVVDSKSLKTISYGTDDLVVGNGFIGLIDELATYNSSLNSTEISSHYIKSNGGYDYCSVSNIKGGGSTTQSNFTISGCKQGDLSVSGNSCSSDGLHYCGSENGQYVLYNTLYDNLGCSKGVDVVPDVSQQCCPAGYVCEKTTDPNDQNKQVILCDQRTESCANQPTQTECKTNGCSWLNVSGGICVDTPGDYSCDIYKTKQDCLNDTFSLGKIGVGTEVCRKPLNGFNVNNTDYVIPFESCRCDWTAEDKCKFAYDVKQSISPTEGGDEFRCTKGFNISECTDGVQLVKWGAIANITSGYLSGIVPPEVLAASGCVSNAVGTERDCGAPVIKNSFFSLFSLLSSIGIIGLYYFLRERD